MAAVDLPYSSQICSQTMSSQASVDVHIYLLACIPPRLIHSKMIHCAWDCSNATLDMQSALKLKSVHHTKFRCSRQMHLIRFPSIHLLRLCPASSHTNSPKSADSSEKNSRNRQRGTSVAYAFYTSITDQVTRRKR